MPCLTASNLPETKPASDPITVDCRPSYVDTKPIIAQAGKGGVIGMRVEKESLGNAGAMNDRLRGAPLQRLHKELLAFADVIPQ